MNQLQKPNGQTYIMNSKKWIMTFGKDTLYPSMQLMALQY